MKVVVTPFHRDTIQETVDRHTSLVLFRKIG